MSHYDVLISDASSGRNLAELPWSGMQRSRCLGDVGAMSCTLPLEHPAVTEFILGQDRFYADREITVYRNGVPVWNGPLSATECSWSGGVFNLTAREASWYLIKRVLEDDRIYTSEDVFDIVRDLFDYMTSKVSTGDDHSTMVAGTDILAALPRFSVTAGSAGATMDATFSGPAFHYIKECFDKVAADPENGFEWCMTYTAGSVPQSCHRELTLGYPGLGVTQARELTELMLADLGRALDWERGATRVHVPGSGYSKTLQSQQAVDDGILLLEYVDDQTDTSDHGFINARAKDLRRLLRPAPRSRTASYIPDDVLAYGWCDLGDTLPWQVTSPSILTITGTSQRLVQEDVSCDVDGSELVTLTFNDPLTDLGV